ncbi:hypothetical protein EDD15DRAFT_2359506 [Pisolithus albus]|nr:hypothetical protein EDD15DRAFT_2359506 [Pisolithus albus]
MPPPVLAASVVPPAADVAAAPDDIQLEVLERLRAVLATEDGARTSEDVSILNGKTTDKGEGEDEQTITLEIGENGHLIVGDVVAVSPVAESFEGNDERGRSRRVSRR